MLFFILLLFLLKNIKLEQQQNNNLLIKSANSTMVSNFENPDTTSCHPKRSKSVSFVLNNNISYRRPFTGHRPQSVNKEEKETANSSTDQSLIKKTKPILRMQPTYLVSQIEMEEIFEEALKKLELKKKAFNEEAQRLRELSSVAEMRKINNMSSMDSQPDSILSADSDNSLDDDNEITYNNYNNNKTNYKHDDGYVDDFGFGFNYTRKKQNSESILDKSSNFLKRYEQISSKSILNTRKKSSRPRSVKPVNNSNLEHRLVF